MKLVSAHRWDELQTKLKSRFGEFNRTSSASQGRRYPEELRALVRQAIAEGADPVALRQITGISPTAMKQWVSGRTPASTRRTDKPSAPRRLEVIDDKASKRQAAIVVRLQSGITIEFGDRADLNADFLAVLATLGRSHAAAR